MEVRILFRVGEGNKEHVQSFKAISNGSQTEDYNLPLTDGNAKTFYVKYKLNSDLAGINMLLYTPVCLVS